MYVLLQYPIQRISSYMRRSQKTDKTQDSMKNYFRMASLDQNIIAMYSGGPNKKINQYIFTSCEVFLLLINIQD